MLFYTLAVPAGAGYVLWRERTRLSPTKFALSYGFLTARYTDSLYFYELAVVARKLAVAVCITFVSSSPYIRAGAACACLLFAFVVHCSVDPYGEWRHNKLEAACAVCVEILLFFGIMFQDATFSAGAKTAIICLVMVALFAVVAGGVGYDVWTLWLESRGGEGSDVDVDEVAFESATLASLNTGLAGGDLDLDLNYRDKDGNTAAVLATADVSLQDNSGSGSDKWKVVGEGITRLSLCQDYHSLQFFLRAETQKGKALFEHFITVNAKYSIAGLRTHEIHFSATRIVAATFKNVEAAHAFATAAGAALPPELGALTGLEVYTFAGDGGSIDDVPEGAMTPAVAEYRFKLTEAKANFAACIEAFVKFGTRVPVLTPEQLTYVRDLGAGGFGGKLVVLVVSSCVGCVG